MTRTMALACLLLAGCTGQQTQDTMRKGFGHVFKPRHSIERFEAQCAETAFPTKGKCIQEKMEAGYPGWRSDPRADLNEVYIAWLNAAGERVSAGTMSDADARLGAAVLKTRIRELSDARRVADATERQSRMTGVLAGLAILNTATPQPGPLIACRTTPTGLGTTMTTCN